MNCFNGARYLREAIDSVFAQTYDNWEIVFWDNVSTDSSGAIAQSYGSRVRYFRAAHQTPLGEARNLAMVEARGEFVAFLDCDDVLMPDAFERHIRNMADPSCDISYGGIIRMDESGRELGRYAPRAKAGLVLDALLRQFDIYVPAVMIRRAALDRTALTFDPAVVASEEYCLFMQMAAECKFLAVPDVVARYRVHEGSLTNRSISQWAKERDYTLDAIERRHPGIVARFPRAFKEARARARYYEARFQMSRGNKRAALAELRSIALVDVRYFLLFLLLLLPAPVWDAVHRVATRRSVFS
jgi:glycosyltransferase involved in cell wall biosynthesis